MFWILAALLGAILGHVVRRLTPIFLADKSREIPFKGPWVELICAGLFLANHALSGATAASLKGYLFILFLLSIGAADAHRKYVPVLVCWAGTLVGVALAPLFPGHINGLLDQGALAFSLGVDAYQPALGALLLALMGAGAGFLLIWIIRRIFGALAGLEAMGIGDCYIMMMVGAFIGPKAVVLALLPACFIGILIGLVRQVLYGAAHLAFGPALAGGGLIVFWFGGGFVDLIFNFNEMLYNLPPFALLAFAIFLVAALIFMVLRLRAKAAEYEEQIEKDYQDIDKKMQGE